MNLEGHVVCPYFSMHSLHSHASMTFALHVACIIFVMHNKMSYTIKIYNSEHWCKQCSPCI